MQTEHGKIVGNLDVENELEMHGMITGDAIVRAGGILHLHGMVCGNLIVEEGGVAYLHGSVTDNALNRGGILKIYGMVNGYLDQSLGTTLLDPKAMVDGKRGA